MSRLPETTRAPRERILVCGVLLDGQPREHDGAFHEARGLVEAAGAEVAHDVADPLVQRRPRPHPSTMLGKGKVQEVKEAIERTQPDAVLVDNDLSPAQGRNLEKAWGLRIIDRSELILDIFAARAHTKQAKLQVELAQMEYMRPRLLRLWTHLERTEGAVGTRGPGETQLETDRRLISKRISDLKGRLAEIEKRKRAQVRSRKDVFTVGLLGYTNAGKSTILNLLTGSDVLVADMPFATLDTRTRQWELPDSRVVLLSDTVGFLQRLPHHLVASFNATLEEALSVDLILHVVDASHPDARTQMLAVEQTLAGLTRREAEVLVLNKTDLLVDPILLQLLREERTAEMVHLSALTGEGIDRLTSVVTARLDARSAVVEIAIPFADGKSAAATRAAATILTEEIDDEHGCLRITARLTHGALGNLRRALAPDVEVSTVESAADPYAREEASDAMTTLSREEGNSEASGG